MNEKEITQKNRLTDAIKAEKELHSAKTAELLELLHKIGSDMPTNLIEVGFVPELVGTQNDHRQVALVLHRTKIRKTRDGIQPPFFLRQSQLL